MQAKWIIAPWMRRRIARHMERGTSERVIACLVSPVSATPGTKASAPDIVDRPTCEIDLSNVILVRALAGRRAQAVTPAV